MHTNQKRFQCQRPREKRAILRERKEALGSPVNKVDHVEEGVDSKEYNDESADFTGTIQIFDYNTYVIC